MPELPEVENVRLTLENILPKGSRFKKVTLNRPDLRFPFPEKMAERLLGQALLNIQRRAKYLVFETDKYLLLSHLGMTGSWRELSESELHDHMIWEFEAGPTLVFNDPRRFGFVSMYEKGETPVPFIGLGPEPLSSDFSSDYLFQVSRKKNTPLKSFLLDQKTVAGLGNIYVCEALFLARLKPSRKARSLKVVECERLVKAVRVILQQAIRAGGSTIRDYKNAEGKSGEFQQRFRVYGRDGEKCRSCRKPIRLLRQAGRSTFWCSQCQK
jgi:formamidopyrimidine-DNA glycosylase